MYKPDQLKTIIQQNLKESGVTKEELEQALDVFNRLKFIEHDGFIGYSIRSWFLCGHGFLRMIIRLID